MYLFSVYKNESKFFCNLLPSHACPAHLSMSAPVDVPPLHATVPIISDTSHSLIDIWAGSNLGAFCFERFLSTQLNLLSNN